MLYSSLDSPSGKITATVHGSKSMLDAFDAALKSAVEGKTRTRRRLRRQGVPALTSSDSGHDRAYGTAAAASKMWVEFAAARAGKSALGSMLYSTEGKGVL